jgi:hypothetical protein
MPEGAARVVHTPQPHPAQPHIARPDPAYPQPAQPHIARPDTASPRAAQPHAARTDAAYPQAARAYDPAPPEAAGEAVPVATEPLLSRRVPQANLAPELRRHGQGEAAGRADGPLPDAGEARAALSRYQASRQAARAAVDESGAPVARADEAGPGGPTAGGGWS